MFPLVPGDQKKREHSIFFYLRGLFVLFPLFPLFPLLLRQTCTQGGMGNRKKRAFRNWEGVVRTLPMAKIRQELTYMPM